MSLKELIDREIGKHPHNEPLLKAFRPVWEERERLLVRGLEALDNLPVPDILRLNAGMPVMKQIETPLPEGTCRKVALALISFLKEGFPTLERDLDRLESGLQEGTLSFSSLGQGTDPVPAERLLCRQVERVILEGMAMRLEGLWEKVTWFRGYCPVCGSFPSLAIIGEKVGERILHCSRCGHHWRFSRIVCPCCEQESPEGMTFFRIEGSEQEAAFTCDTCRRYLVTLHRVSDTFERDGDVCALGLFHLDIVMQQKGFQPMTDTDWNGIGGEGPQGG